MPQTESGSLTAFRKLVPLMLCELRAVTEDRGFHLVTRRIDEFVSLDSWQEREPEVASTNAFWLHYKAKKMWERPELQDAVMAHVAEENFETPDFTGPSGLVSNPSPVLITGAHASRLIRPVLDHVERTRSTDLSDEVIEAIHAEVVRQWRSPRFHHRIIVPLYGLETVERDLDLLGVMRVRPLNVADKTELAQAGGMFQPIRIAEIASLNTAAFADTACGLGESVDFAPFQNATECFITATRLVGIGRIGAEHLVSRRVQARQEVGASFVSLEGTDTWRPGGAKLRFSDAPEVERVTALLDKAKRRPGFARIAVAIRRFNLAFSRSFPEDGLVDLTIALENTVLADVQEELTYRLAVRAARLLAPTEDPDFIFRLAKGMYTVRSKVVHEGQSLTSAIKEVGVKPYWKAKSVPQDAFVFIHDCERLVSKLLTRFITAVDSGRSVKELIDEADDAIIGRNRPLT